MPTTPRNTYAGITLTWKDVLDFKEYMPVDSKLKIARTTGYQFFTHESKVYRVPSDHAEDTGLTVSDLI